MRTYGHTYAGNCADTDIATDGGAWCSTLYETRGTQRIYIVGPAFSEYTTWLLLEQSDRMWRVVDCADVKGSGPPPW